MELAGICRGLLIVNALRTTQKHNKCEYDLAGHAKSTTALTTDLANQNKHSCPLWSLCATALSKSHVLAAYGGMCMSRTILSS